MGMGAVSIAGIFLFHGQLLDGMALYWNDMADILGSVPGFTSKGLRLRDTGRGCLPPDISYLSWDSSGSLRIPYPEIEVLSTGACLGSGTSCPFGNPWYGTGCRHRSYFLHGDPFGTESYPFPFWKETPPGREQPGIFDRKHPGMCGNAGSGILLEQFMPSEDYGSSTLVTEAKKEAWTGSAACGTKKERSIPFRMES